VSLTSYPGALDSFTGKQDNVDYVLADHVNFLQEAVDAIQTVLGTDPHGIADDVKARISAVETDLDTHKDSGDHDDRYIDHSHTGAGGDPPKINLVTHVTSKLRTGNIELTHDATGALLGTNIPLNSSGSGSISTAIGNRLALSGGTLTGNLTAPKFISTASSGQPIEVASTTQVTNLNASLIMGRRVYVQSTAPTVMSAGDIWIDTT